MADDEEEISRKFPDGPLTPLENELVREFIDEWRHAKWFRRSARRWTLYAIAIFGGLYAIKDWIERIIHALVGKVP